MDEQLFNSYIEEKANPIVGALEQNMYTGKFDWSECCPPLGMLKFLNLILPSVEGDEMFSSPSYISLILGPVSTD